MGRLRLRAAAWVALLLCAPHADTLALVALPLGYGHLLGAALSSRRRAAGLRARARGVVAAVVVVDLFVAYLWALRTPALRAPLLLAMLLASAWHIVENDLAMGPARRDGLRLGPLPRAPRRHVLALAFALAVALLALGTPGGARLALLHLGRVPVPLLSPLPLETLLAAVVLYHGVAWILFAAARARALPPPGRRRLRRRLLWIHALPLALGAALHAWLPQLHAYAASPALYLFWSLLHALQTARARGLEHRRRPSPAPASA